MITRFDTIQERDRQQDRQTDRQTSQDGMGRAYAASRGKSITFINTTDNESVDEIKIKQTNVSSK